MSIPKVSLFGIPFSKMNMKQTVDYLTAVIERKEPHQVITANPIMVMAALEDPNYSEMMRRAELIVPDGAGVVWAAEYVGNPVAERVAGYDLLHELMKAGEQKQWKVYLLGASSEVIQASAAKLKLMYRRLKLSEPMTAFFSGRTRTRRLLRRLKRRRLICSLSDVRHLLRSHGSTNIKKSSCPSRS